MTPEERYRALADVPAAEVERLADCILAGEPGVEVLAGPEVVSAPLRYQVSDTGSTAVLGHLALTTCAVTVAGVRGDGIRPGRDLPAAVAAAVCDAEAERRGGLAEDVLRLCVASRSAAGRRDGERAAVVAATRAGGAA